MYLVMKEKHKKRIHETTNNSRKNIIYVLLLIITFSITYGKIFDSKLDLNGDNFSYLLLAKNISDGHGYTTLSVDGAYKPASWFPPGYPYLLAISNFVVNDNVKGLKIINGLLFLSTILLFFSMLKRITKNAPFSFSISFLLIINSGLLRLSTMIMSEIPYLFFSVLAFYAITKWEEKEEKVFWKSKLFYLAIISSAISLYMRSFGLMLIGAVTVHWLIQKKWKLAGGYLLGSIILYSPYQIRNVIYGIKGRYLKTIMIDNPWRPESGQISSFSAFWDKIITNLNDTIIHGFPKVLFPTIDSAELSLGVTFLGIFILLVTFWGIWQLKGFRYLFGCYIIMNIGIFLLWHGGNGVRYVWPLAGFISFGFFYGILEIIRYLLKKEKDHKAINTIGYSFLIISFFLFPKIQELEDGKKK